MKISSLKLISIVSSLAAITGCAHVVETKTIVSNGAQYMAEHFTPAQLNQPVREALNRGETFPKLFSKIDLITTAESEDNGKISTVTGKVTYTNLGNGFLQQRTEYSKNDVTYRINLALLYAGIHTVKRQSTFTDFKNAQNPVEMREVSQFDRGVVKPREGQSYIYATKYGTPEQISNLLEYKETCVAGRAIDASSVNASFSGQAVPLECTRIGVTGLVTSKAKFVWIEKLGMAFLTETTDSSVVTRYKISSVSIAG